MTVVELRNPPQQKRSEKRHEQLREATRRAIQMHGWQRVTTATIGHLAGASIGTVYRYYADVHVALDDVMPVARHGIEAVLELHQRVISFRLVGHDAAPDFPSQEEARDWLVNVADLDAGAVASDLGRMERIEVCAHCAHLEISTGHHWSESTGQHLASVWPCPTIRALQHDPEETNA